MGSTDPKGEGGVSTDHLNPRFRPAKKEPPISLEELLKTGTPKPVTISAPSTSSPYDPKDYPDQVTCLTAEIDQLKLELAGSKTALASSLNTGGALQRELDAMTVRAGDLQTAVSTYQHREAEARAELVKAKEERDAAKTDLGSMKRAYDQALANLDTQGADLTRAMTKLKALREAIFNL